MARSTRSTNNGTRVKQENGEEDGDGAAAPNLCAVCHAASSKVTIECSACAQAYHLSCHSPPLRRRPAADTEWNCASCDGKEPSDEEEAAPPARKKRRATVETVASSTSRQLSDAVKKEDDSMEGDDSDVPLAAAQRRKNGKQPLAKVAARKSVKVQEPELAYKRASRAAARGRGSTRKNVITIIDEDEEDDGGDDDNDNDSDFSGGSESEKHDEDEDDDEEESDEDFQRPVNYAAPRPVKKPAKKPAAKKTNAKRPAKPKTTQTAAAQPTAGDADGSNAAPIEIDDEDPAENSDEEAYQGPTYRVEYAENGRAKCKSCEEKLERGQLRIGVRVRHSMFGITTYFKHVECTQICWNSELEANESDVNSQLRGLASLSLQDRGIVVAHMKKTAEQGLLDERRELSEDQYTRKSRMAEKEPSPHLTATLLPYQREALGWMTAQEASHYKGGILADEMGMGKTIQTIALILEKPRDGTAPVPASASAGRAVPKSKSKKPALSKAVFKATHRGGTLVVCPVVAVMQWKSEIERFVERDHLSIYIHHGNKRIDLVEKIASYDIVLTTYSIIENEVRKMLGWEKVACKYCKKKYLPDKLVLHNKYFCGPNAKKTALQDRQQTKTKGKKAAGEDSDSSDDDLVKKPKAKGKAKPRASKKKKKDDSEDDDSDDDDVVIPQRKQAAKASIMHQIYWTRIVLDEAHYIKDKQSNTARGVFELQSDYKWCLTGTPLQNRIGELFSLVRFLRIKSFAYYHCSKCECQMIDFNFVEGKCVLCDHNSMSHFSFFNKKIVVPIQSYGYVAEGKLAMLRLQNELLQHILLRRTKDGRADDISLPPKLIRIRRDRLDERENDFYQAIYTQSQAQFNTYVSSGTLLNNYAHIFDLLIRLRQAVDHPYLVIYSKSNPAIQLPLDADAMADDGRTFIRPLVQEKPLVAVAGTDAEASDAEAPSCAVCHEDVEDPVESACAHVFCRECVKEFIESLPVGAAATCPECDKPLTVDLSPPKPSQEEEEDEIDPHKPVIHRALVDMKRFHKHSILHRINDIDSFQTSTKIEALMQELEHMKVRDPSGKAIIFSQFVNMLDIIEHRLTIGGVKCVKLSGNMSMELRDRTIRTFREDNAVTAFLISLKAGGVALNLTIASHIFLMDPWWNPAAENQAIDRTHRLGQFKPVQATRFIIAGTIEERILKLQQKKQLIFEGTVGGSVSAITRLTEEDLRFLFSK